ncbi:hypothetical protein ACWEPC_58850 [Nonomuraea sp. NPDC004297]
MTGSDTAPQPRVSASGLPVEPSGGSGKRPPERPTGSETVVLPERPASAAESTAKPKGPLPTGSPDKPAVPGKGGADPEKTAFVPGKGTSAPGKGGSAAGAASGADPERTASVPGKGAAGRPPAPKAGVSKGEPPKGDASGPKSASKDGPAKSGAASEAGSPESEAGDGQEKVKVIVGTRRYHSTSCPLIRGAGDTGVETMTLKAAEAAGLTSCSVCQHDRETVA